MLTVGIVLLDWIGYIRESRNSVSRVVREAENEATAESEETVESVANAENGESEYG